MNIDLENNIQTLITELSEDSFIYDLLLAYDQPKSTITRLKKGDYNLSKEEGEILWKKKLFFKKETEIDLHELIDQIKNDNSITKHHPRFIIITDFQTLLSVDTKTKDTLDIPILELPKYYDFFLPWAGMEKSQFQSEAHADVKAAEQMGQLYDIILESNSIESNEEIHALNIFLSRLLFCFFAEDTGIFSDDQFTNAVASHTSDDGSDLQVYLQKLFKVLNLRQRSDFPQFLQDFPYVNGGLFADDYLIPQFNAKSRKIIIECGALNWKLINPDIFGSMMQAVVHTHTDDQRSSLGMHYTSVVNIMKVIEPLFLNDLYDELEKAWNNEKKLENLLSRLYHLRIFDPACGSGNFLIIAYKELCKLEIEIYKQLQHLNSKWMTAKSGLRLKQFYGIELDDFAHETTMLSLWLTEHQMNLAFKEVFGDTRPTLPLQDSGNIYCGNATQLDWNKVCPKEDDVETYIFGNPPYLGYSMQSKEQKDDMALVFDGIKGYKNLDYINCWFYLAAKYIHKSKIQFSFVSTNSICQGEQVALLWPHIFELGAEISFAHQSFKWMNNAKGNAGVTCIVVGVRNLSTKPKFLFNGNIKNSVKNINPYLSNGRNLVVAKRTKPLSTIPVMLRGNGAVDGGNLLLSQLEKDELISSNPETSQFIKKLIGAHEFLNGINKYCLWITNSLLKAAIKIPEISIRFDKVKASRLSSKKKATQAKSNVPHQFGEIRYKEKPSIFIPSVSSERRQYIPFGFLEPEDIVVAPNLAIYDPPTYIFAIISSRIHMTWVRTVAGRLKTDYRYSSALCYNTFPFPDITEANKNILEEHVFRVLDEREKQSEKTIAELYDPDKMPEELRKVHNEMDQAVEQCYRSRPFKNDAERLEYLFNLYMEMIEAEEKEGK